MMAIVTPGIALDESFTINYSKNPLSLNMVRFTQLGSGDWWMQSAVAEAVQKSSPSFTGRFRELLPCAP